MKKMFKKTLHRFLIENAFYSVDKFLSFNVNNFDNFNKNHALIAVIDNMLINLLYLYQISLFYMIT
jgi:hypothetical protein